MVRNWFTLRCNLDICFPAPQLVFQSMCRVWLNGKASEIIAALCWSWQADAPTKHQHERLRVISLQSLHKLTFPISEQTCSNSSCNHVWSAHTHMYIYNYNIYDYICRSDYRTWYDMTSTYNLASWEAGCSIWPVSGTVSGAVMSASYSDSEIGPYHGWINDWDV